MNEIIETKFIQQDLDFISDELDEALQLQQISSLPILQPLNILVVTNKDSGLCIGDWLYNNYPRANYIQDKGEKSHDIRNYHEPFIHIYDSLYSQKKLNMRNVFIQFLKYKLNPINKKKSDAPLLALTTTYTGEIDDSRPIQDQLCMSPILYSSFDLVFVVDCEVDDSIDKLPRMYEMNIEPDLEVDNTIQVYQDVDSDKPIYKQGMESIRDNYIRVRRDNGSKYLPSIASKLKPWTDIALLYAIIDNSKRIELKHVDKTKELIYSSLIDVGFDKQSNEYDFED